MPQKASKENQQFQSLSETKTADSKKLIEIITEGLKAKKAQDITILDIHRLTTLADKFIICHASTDVQIKAIANSVIEHTSRHLDEKPWKEEGRDTRRWVILDYVNVVVHI